MDKKTRDWLLEPKALPSTTHGDNLRKIFPRSLWDKIRKLVYERANHVCELCGGTGYKHPVEAHELWEFDFDTNLQYLIKLVALCPNCHRVQHAMLLKIHDDKNIVNADSVIRHLNKVANTQYNYQSFFAKATSNSEKFENIPWDVAFSKCSDEILEKVITD